MDSNEKADISGEMEFVENDSGELTDLKLPENEKAIANGDHEGEEKSDGKANENAERKETDKKDTEGEESGLDNVEIDKEMAAFLTEVPLKQEKDTESMEMESAQPKTETREVKKPMYCDKVIGVSGFPLLKTAALKRLLLDKLGAGNVRIKPRAKDEKEVYIYFASEDLLNQGKEVLDKQDILSYKLKVKIVSGLDLKHKLEQTRQVEIKQPQPEIKGPRYTTRSVKRKMDEEAKDEPQANDEAQANDEPPSKKDKKYFEREGKDFYFSEETYDEQVTYKNKNARKIVEELGKSIRANIPQVELLISNREKKNNGLICKLHELAECSPAQRLFARCKFVIGIDEDTGEIALGFITSTGKMKKNYSARQYFLPNILQAADVFEKLVKSTGREPGKGASGFWRKLIVRSSTEGKVMLTVVVQSDKERAQQELDYLKGIITDFYENGEGKKSKVTSVYSKVMYISHRQKRAPASIMDLSWGRMHLEEKFLGIRLLLDPRTFFYFNVHAAGIICNTVTDLLNPSKRISIVEIGCYSGYLGMHLAKFGSEILCVGTKPAPAEYVLKERSSRCQYYPGMADSVLRTLKITHAKACAVITTAPQALAPKLSLELRRKAEIKRIVIITEATAVNSSRALMLLMKPADSEELRNPFFPKQIIPVDTMPNAKHYTMVILMERIGTDSLPKLEAAGTYTAAKLGKQSPLRKNMQPNRMGLYQNFGSVWDERAFPLGSLNLTDFPAAINQPFVEGVALVENQLLNPLNNPKMVYADILQRQDFINNEILAEEHRRRLLEEREAEAYRQRLLEEKEREAEEYRQRLIEQKEREAEQYRQQLLQEKQREAAEYQRRMQEERAAEEYRQMQLKERLKALEEEEYRRRLLIEARERQLQELTSKPTIQEVLSDTMKGGALSRLDTEAAVKLKQVIAEAIRGAGILHPEGQAMKRSGQDRIMSDAQYSHFAPDHRNPIAGTSVVDKSGDRNLREGRNLQFKDDFSRNRRGNERDPIGDRRGFDNTTRMTSGRTDRDVHTRSLDNREMMPYSGRTPKETEAGLRDRPVSLLSLKFHSNIQANRNLSTVQQVPGQKMTANEMWRNEDNNMYRRNWSDDVNRGVGRSESWRSDTRQTGRSNDEPYLRGVNEVEQDDWRGGFANDRLAGGREAYGNESRMHSGRNASYERESAGGSLNLKPSVYGHIYGRSKPSGLDSYRKPY